MSRKIIETKNNLINILRKIDDFIYIIGDKVL